MGLCWEQIRYNNEPAEIIYSDVQYNTEPKKVTSIEANKYWIPELPELYLLYWDKINPYCEKYYEQIAKPYYKKYYK